MEHYEQKMMAELIFSALDVKETRDWTKSYRLAESLQLRVWERLNTGHWSQVDHAWRQLYALLTLLRIHLLSDNLLEAGHLDSRARGMLSRELVRMADVGWLMGGPAMDNLCSKVAQATCEWISRAEKRSEDASEDDHATAKKRKVIMTHSEKLSAPVATGSTFIQALPKVDLAVLDLVTFLFNHKSKNSPVIIQGATSDWSASTKWNFDYLRDRFGPRCVPVEVGSRYTDENWTQTIMSIDHFVTEFITGASLAKDKLKNTGYLAQHQLLDQVRRFVSTCCTCSVLTHQYFVPTGSDPRTDGRHMHPRVLPDRRRWCSRGGRKRLVWPRRDRFAPSHRSSTQHPLPGQGQQVPATVSSQRIGQALPVRRERSFVQHKQGRLRGGREQRRHFVSKVYDCIRVGRGA